MSRGASKGRTKTTPQELSARARDETPRHSHVRELTPRSHVEIEVDEESTAEETNSGFFGQSAIIKMGDTFPALKTVARFLALESYRSLPKPDKLPDLSDIPNVTGVHEEVTPQPSESIASRSSADALLDWDEMEVEDHPKTPYQLYLFDLRIEDYLRQTRGALGPRMLKKP